MGKVLAQPLFLLFAEVLNFFVFKLLAPFWAASKVEVIEAAAYAVHHPRLGEDVAAAVVLKAGSTVAEDDLIKFLSTQLASFKVPRRIVFQASLPKGPTGKLQRQKLGTGA